jgi:hypothetical protein
MPLNPEKNSRVIDKHDFELFGSLSQFIWIQGEPLIFMYEIGHEVYTSQGIDLQALRCLEAAGLLCFDLIGYVKKGFGKHTRLFYFGEPTKIQFPRDENNALDIGHAILTEQGKTLALVSNASPNQKFYEYTIETWFRQGLVTSSILARSQPINLY